MERDLLLIGMLVCVSGIVATTVAWGQVGRSPRRVRETRTMRGSRLLQFAAFVGGTVFAVDRLLDRQVDVWRANPDPTDGDPLGMPGGRDIFLRARDGAELRGFVAGPDDGPRVLLVHGAGRSAEFWAPISRQLVEKGMLVLAVDQRGHGRSSRGRLDLSPSTLAEDLAEWLDAQDLHRATVVGHSLGATAALHYVVGHRTDPAARVGAMVLIGAAAHVPPRPRAAPAARRVAALVPKLSRLPRLGLVASLPVAGDTPALAHLEAVRQSTARNDPETIRAVTESTTLGFDLRGHLSDVHVPTRVVVGSQDRITPVDSGRALAGLLPNATLSILPGAGHLVYFAHGAEIAAEIEAAANTCAERGQT